MPQYEAEIQAEVAAVVEFETDSVEDARKKAEEAFIEETGVHLIRVRSVELRRLK